MLTNLPTEWGLVPELRHATPAREPLPPLPRLIRVRTCDGLRRIGVSDLAAGGRKRSSLVGATVALVAIAGCTEGASAHDAGPSRRHGLHAGCPAFDDHRISVVSMEHTAAEARRQAPLVAGADVIEVFPVRIVDPVGRKVGLSSPDAPRNMWVVRVTWHYEPSPGAIGGMGQPTPGAVVTANYVVDDVTLRLAGNLDCRSPLRG